MTCFMDITIKFIHMHVQSLHEHKEKARAMLFEPKMAKIFRVDSVAYLVIRNPASALQDGKTPLEL